MKIEKTIKKIREITTILYNIQVFGYVDGYTKYQIQRVINCPNFEEIKSRISDLETRLVKENKKDSTKSMIVYSETLNQIRDLKAFLSIIVREYDQVKDDVYLQGNRLLEDIYIKIIELEDIYSNKEIHGKYTVTNIYEFFSLPYNMRIIVNDKLCKICKKYNSDIEIQIINQRPNAYSLFMLETIIETYDVTQGLKELGVIDSITDKLRQELVRIREKGTEIKNEYNMNKATLKNLKKGFKEIDDSDPIKKYIGYKIDGLVNSKRAEIALVNSASQKDIEKYNDIKTIKQFIELPTNKIIRLNWIKCQINESKGIYKTVTVFDDDRSVDYSLNKFLEKMNIRLKDIEIKNITHALYIEDTKIPDINYVLKVDLTEEGKSLEINIYRKLTTRNIDKVENANPLMVQIDVISKSEHFESEILSTSFGDSKPIPFEALLRTMNKEDKITTMTLIADLCDIFSNSLMI